MNDLFIMLYMLLRTKTWDHHHHRPIWKKNLQNIITILIIRSVSQSISLLLFYTKELNNCVELKLDRVFIKFEL
jgi:hypothetical protein